MKKIDTKRMGELLTMLREDAGLSRKDACSAAGCTYAALANLEKGKNEPRLSTLFSLCEAYDHLPTDVIDMFTEVPNAQE
jgi:transcriptional regulator with XRE-family HTH domain